jgi:rhamnopyranosyl-N-acetylglucosaminyl-diphospho-decaprenol beta-1,3/1,4-galactofuranosyltransferase
MILSNLQMSGFAPETKPENNMKIAAIIVTRNRRKLLERCVKSMLTQTRQPDRVYVVDVASTDDTLDFLSLADSKIKVVSLKDNVGGAGGFHAGIGSAFEDGYDWMWCMDDDGFASPDALARLEAMLPQTTCDWLNSLVVDAGNDQNLAFRLFVNGELKRLRGEIEEIGVLKGDANPFNGTLLSRKLVAQIGLPLKELFIRGDEAEYLNRAKKKGFNICTVATSIFFHPQTDALPIWQTSLKDSWRFYYIVRNTNASITSDGRAKLSFKGACTSGLDLIGSTIRIRGGELKKTFGSGMRDIGRIAIVIHAIFAAAVNDCRRRYR